MNYTKLKSELAVDPIARGYTGMDNDTAAATFSVSDREVNKTHLGVDEIYDALDLAEFSALSANDKARVDRILSMGGSVKVQGNVKTELASIFGAGTNTRTALLSAIKTTQTRSVELELGSVDGGDVGVARNL